MGCIDRDGLAVSYIQSRLLGIRLRLRAAGNRHPSGTTGASASPSTRRASEPWSRAASPSTPSIRRLAVFDDGRVLVLRHDGRRRAAADPGQIFTRYADFGMGLADAVDAPRWRFGTTMGPVLGDPEGGGSLRSEACCGPGRLGHPVEELGKPYADALGHAGMLVRHPRNGRVEAAHDPRSDGGSRWDSSSDRPEAERGSRPARARRRRPEARARRSPAPERPRPPAMLRAATLRRPQARRWRRW